MKAKSFKSLEFNDLTFTVIQVKASNVAIQVNQLIYPIAGNLQLVQR